MTSMQKVNDVAATATEASAAEVPPSAPPAFLYRIPDWFLDNVKTVDDLQAIKAKIWLTMETEAESQKKTGQSPHTQESVPQLDEIRADDAKAREAEDVPHQPPSFLSGSAPCEAPANSINASDSGAATPESSLSEFDAGRSGCYSIPHEAFEDLLDAAAALHVNARARRFLNRRCTIGLFSKMRHGLPFLDELVVLMAQELQCSLISLHPYELEDIAAELYDQERAAVSDGRLEARGNNEDSNPHPDTTLEAFAYTHKVFGARAERKAYQVATDRTRDAIFALLDTVKRKTTEANNQKANDTTAEATPPPTILYIRDSLCISKSNQALARQVLCRMRDAVNKRRQAGQDIMLVVGMTHAGVESENQQVDAETPWNFTTCYCSLCSCGSLENCDARSCDMGAPMRKLGARGLFMQMMMPLSVPQGWEDVSKARYPNSRASIRIESFKRRIHARLSDYPPSPFDILKPDSDWPALLSERAARYLVSITDNNEEMNMAFLRIVAKSARSRSVQLHAIESVLLRMKGADPEPEPVSIETENDDRELDEEEKTKRAKKIWEDKLNEIKQEANGYEKRLFPCIIDPTSLNSGFDDVILDNGMLASIKTLVALSKLKPDAASKLLVSQIRTTGALLYGPPGTGKTLLARAIAKSTGSNMLAINPATINNKYVGESEKTIEAAFTLAKRLFPCIIFIDEVDALFYRRGGNDRSWERSQLTQFLQEMDGLGQDSKAPFVLAATNRPMDLDSAFLRRLPQKIPFGVPGKEARASILRVFLKEDDLDGVDIDRLAAVTDGFSGSDLKNLCGQAGLAWAVEQDMEPMEEVVSDSLKVRLTEDHFETALGNIQPSVSQTDMNALNAFTKEFGPSIRVPISRKLASEREKVALETDIPEVFDGQKNSEISAEPRKEDTTKSVEDFFPMALRMIISSILPSEHPDIRRRIEDQHGSQLTDSLLWDFFGEAIPETRSSIQSPLTKGFEGGEPLSSDTEDAQAEPHEDISDLSPDESVLPIINPPEAWHEKTRLSYIYMPLPTATSIRLLKVYTIETAHPTDQHQAIRCSMVTVDLAENPDYFALSYTWGDPRTLYTNKSDIFPREAWAAPAFDIECDGRPVTVATNLYTALISLREGLGSGRTGSILGSHYIPQGPDYFYLWVDALCINQDDMDEKSCQIPLMDRIYGKARATLMWLGGNEPLAAKGLKETMEKLSLVEDKIKELCGESKEDLDTAYHAFDILDPQAYQQIGLESIDRIDLIGWYLFMSRSWFKRAWVIQEWVLSPNCMFFLGNLAIVPAKVIERTIKFYQWHWVRNIQGLVQKYIADSAMDIAAAGDQSAGIEHQDLSVPPLRRRRAVPRLYRAELSYSILQDVDRALFAVGLLRLFQNTDVQHMMSKLTPAMRAQLCSVHQFRGLQSMDPRDKIYALRSLFRDETGNSMYPAPDYTKDVRDVYIEAAEVLVAQVGMSLLVFRETRADNPHNLPSWVPDFQRDTGGFFIAQPKFYMASSGLGKARVELKPGHVLGVRGCRVDSVVHTQWYYNKAKGTSRLDHNDQLAILGRIPETSWIAPPPKGKDLDEWHGCVDPAPPAYRPSEATPQSRYEVLWRTHYQDVENGHHPAPDRCGSIYTASFEINFWRRFRTLVRHDMRMLLEPLAQGPDDAPHDPFLAQIVERDYSDIFGGAPGGPQDASYDRDVAVADLFDRHATLAMFEGALPFGSAERPAPPCWTDYVRLHAEVLAARDRRNYARLDEGLAAVGQLIDCEPDVVPADVFTGRGSRVGRSLSATSGGRLALSESDDVREGDEIWALAGLHVPVALRRLGEGRYAVVGCLYVHGIMHGEGVPVGGGTVDIDLV